MTHPLTPPLELVQQWLGEFFGCTVSGELSDSERFLANRAAQWGADQELEACLRLVEIDAGEDAYDFSRYIRAARRPKPPSLKKQALAILAGVAVHELYGGATTDNRLSADDMITIRRALEALPE